MQKMIDTISVMPGQEEVEYVWEVPKGTMCHFWALVYNADVARVSEIINIYYE